MAGGAAPTGPLSCVDNLLSEDTGTSEALVPAPLVTSEPSMDVTGGMPEALVTLSAASEELDTDGELKLASVGWALEGVASGREGVTSGREGVASGREGVASGREGVASGCEGVASGCEGVTSGCEGVTSGCEGVTSGCEGVVSGCEGVTSGREGVSDGLGPDAASPSDD